MKLNWFSPLPPARTDIAHYTKRLLPALSRVAQVTLWADQNSWDRELEDHADVRRFDLRRMPWKELNRADISLYQIGNDAQFHGAIWRVSQMLAGVVVLHDYRLHHFFDQLLRAKLNNPYPYLNLLERYHGRVARSEGLINCESNGGNVEYMATRYPLTKAATENALAVLVHTDEAFGAVASEYAGPVALAPLPFPVKRAGFTRRARKSDRCRLVLFGYIGLNRRLNSVLQALAGMENRDRFQLDIFGSILNDEQKVKKQIKVLKLQNQVTLHGFKPEAQLDKALADCDLAINLRYPTMGEASGSQLRIWAHGLPSLVSRVGWYETLPEDSVAYVRPDENEVSDIQNHLRSFLAAPERFVRMGERGRQVLAEKHSPEAYAESVTELARLAQDYRAEAASNDLAERAAGAAAVWLTEEELAKETFRRVAVEVCAMMKRN